MGMLCEYDGWAARQESTAPETEIIDVDLRALPKKRREPEAARLVLSDRRGVLLWIRTM